MKENIIEIQNIVKSYEPGKPVLKNLSLVVPKGSFVTIIGPSGCGKTTLLRLINGMEEAESGQVHVLGKDLSKWDKIQLRRNIGYAIQRGGLFPHLTIKQNIGFVLSISGNDNESIDKRVSSLAEIMSFDDRQLSSYPAELSGGQQQRAGVARALAANPQIILMDEPFGALDNITRRNLQNELKEMHKKLGITFVMVTHDVREAFTLGKKVVVMNKGIIEQYDTPENIRENPANGWVEEFTRD